MQLMVMENHGGEGEFPIFTKGTKVEDLNQCVKYDHWYSCTIEGYETYIPDIFEEKGFLTRDYNPTELVAKKFDLITLESVAYDWILAKDNNGISGWIPASKVVSV